MTANRPPLLGETENRPLPPRGTMTWYAHILCGIPFVPVALIVALLGGWFGDFTGDLGRSRGSGRFIGNFLLLAGGTAWLLYKANAGIWQSRFPLWEKVAGIVGIGVVATLVVGGLIAFIVGRYMPS